LTKDESTSPPHPPGLYESLLGDAWRELHPAVREAHGLGSRTAGSGRFRVARGRTLAARLVARLLGLPAECVDCPVELRVERAPDAETWVRTFGTKRLVTRQRSDSDGMLVETFGVLAFRFRLTVVEAGIRFSQRACRLRLARLGLPLPSWLSPRIEAAVRPVSRGSRTSLDVSVNVFAPLAVLVLSYEGELAIGKEPTWK
jgi:hypothetical protein